MESATCPPSGTATRTKPAQALAPESVRDFTGILDIMGQAAGVALADATNAHRPDLVAPLIRCRQALAEALRDLVKGGA